MYRKTFLIFLIGSLFLAPPVLAGDYADSYCEFHDLHPGEEGLCNTYCEILGCYTILDGDPLSAPQASLEACANVATTFMSKYLDVKRSEIDPIAAMQEMDMVFCCMDCGGGGGV